MYFEDLAVGDRVTGTIVGLKDYGAVVDIGGIEALLHISEMSWTSLAHPGEMFRRGQQVEVVVLRLDASTRKVSLGHRQVLPDPWLVIKQNYALGERMTVRIDRVVQSGAFTMLPEGAEAFIPSGLKRSCHGWKQGDEVDVEVIDLRPHDRRMVLRVIG